MTGSARGGATRERLLEAAEREFARYGYAGAHLQSIAEQIGVQKTALYHYFASKSALYNSVMIGMLDSIERALADAVAESGSHREKLERVLDALNELLASRPHIARIVIRLFIDGSGAAEDPALADTIRRVIGRLLAFHREGVEAGAFRRLSSRHAFLSVFGMVLFHYAAPAFSAAVLDAPDVFAADLVAWRGSEVRELLLGGVLAPSASGASG